MGDGLLRIAAVHSATQAVPLISADGNVDGQLVFPNVVVDQRPVFPGHAVHPKLLRQRFMRLVVLRNHEKAAGVLIDSMHDAVTVGCVLLALWILKTEDRGKGEQ